jgi:ACDE family multidrug resistance protein
MDTRQNQEKLQLNSSLLITFTITLISVLGVNSISPALPKIVQELGISNEVVGFLITAYTIPGVLLSLPLGISADRFGRKQILLPSLFLFGLAGSLCALVRDFTMLLVLRFFQGIGAAPLNALGVIILGDMYSGQVQKDAISYNGSILSVGTTLYPVIGGFLATIAWYYPFALPIVAFPIGLAVIFWLDIPEQKNSKDMMEYLRNAWVDIKCKRVLGLLASSTVSLFLLYGAYMTFFPIFLDERFNTDPWVIGIFMSSMTLVTASASSQLPRLTRRTSQIQLLTFSFILYGSAVFLVPFTFDLWLTLIPLIIFGIGHGICFPTFQSLLSDSTATEYRAAIMSINATSVRIGQTLGPLMTGIAYIIGGLGAPFILCTIVAFANVLSVKVLVKEEKKSTDNQQVQY